MRLGHPRIHDALFTDPQRFFLYIHWNCTYKRIPRNLAAAQIIPHPEYCAIGIILMPHRWHCSTYGETRGPLCSAAAPPLKLRQKWDWMDLDRIQLS